MVLDQSHRQQVVSDQDRKGLLDPVFVADQFFAGKQPGVEDQNVDRVAAALQLVGRRFDRCQIAKVGSQRLLDCSIGASLEPLLGVLRLVFGSGSNNHPTKPGLGQLRRRFESDP